MKAYIPQPWERQPKESDVAFAAFTVYRDMGPDRSIPKVAQKCTKNVSLIKRWSSTHRWAVRIEAWTDEQDRLMREELIKGVTVMRKNHTDIAVSMLTKALDALGMIPAVDMTMQDIARAVDVAAKLERLSRGEATERTESQTELTGKMTVATDPFEGLTTEELREYIRARKNEE